MMGFLIHKFPRGVRQRQSVVNSCSYFSAPLLCPHASPDIPASGTIFCLDGREFRLTIFARADFHNDAIFFFRRGLRDIISDLPVSF